MRRVTLEDHFAFVGVGIYSVNASRVPRPDKEIAVWCHNKSPNVGGVWFEHSRYGAIRIHAVDATFRGRGGKDGAVTV